LIQAGYAVPGPLRHRLRVSAKESSARRSVAVDVWAWTAAEPTRLLTGTTIELGPEDAVLRLPKLPDAGDTLTLRIAIPDRGALARATVASRQATDVVTVVFDSIDPYERGRIRTFIDTAE
jgi:hypothetical protein